MKKDLGNMFDLIICYNGDFSKIFSTSNKNLVVLNSKKTSYAKKRAMHKIIIIIISQAVFLFALILFKII
jgi:hypothetical protein